jgi:hypothetical protein
VLHQAGNEMHVTAQTVELGDNHGRFLLLGPLDRLCQLGAVVILAAFHFS